MIRLAQFQNLLFSPSSLNIPLKQADDLSWIWEAEQKPSPWTTPIQFTWHLRTQGNEGHAGQLQGNTLMLGRTEGRGEEDKRGWHGWMASPTQWTWVWVSSGRWWRTGNPGELQSKGSQQVGHNLRTTATAIEGNNLEQQCVLLHEDQLGKNRSLPCGTSPHLIMNIFKVCPIENTLTR